MVRLEGFTLLWKKDGRIISLGDNILDNVCILIIYLKTMKNKNIFVQPDSRFTLDKKENGNYLIIGLARISDEGEVSLFVVCSH